MTYEEALISCDMVCTECQRIKGNKCDKENCANAFKKKAIEKQIPKKPKNQRLAEGRLGDNGVYAGNCPSCKEKVIGNYYGNYCGCCGQALDWSE